MQVQTCFRDLDKTDTLEAYLRDKIGSSIENFLKKDPNSTATVRIELDRHRNQNRKPSFVCEVILKPTHQKGTLKVSKGGEDFYTAVNEAAAALRTILRRRSTRKSQHRRHEHTREIRDLFEEWVA
ncbi:MAG TPA: HPF/RaiA family ribosome-associated protein [Pseudobdellovibrionaceae bacterium]|jgi:ribosomal subunit interface protein